MTKSYGRTIKRGIDIIFSLLVIFFGLPVFVIIAILVVLSDGFPILFKQKRIGKNGKVFTLYKFRTMVKNAERLKKKYLKLNEADGPVFKITNDPRFINGIGKFLAQSGLDELPNVFNVLRGEMSWVGPRPLPVQEAKKIKTKIKKIRESVLPGITSSWVINGAHQLRFKKWMKLDCNYIKELSLLKDIEILTQTFILCIRSTKKFLF